MQDESDYSSETDAEQEHQALSPVTEADLRIAGASRVRRSLSDCSSASGSSPSSCSSVSPASRLYKGKDTRTVLLRQDKLRVSKSKRREEIANNDNKRQRQASNGKVKPCVPKPFFPCCKRKCAGHFLDSTLELLVEAREPLFDSCLSRSHMRELVLPLSLFSLFSQSFHFHFHCCVHASCLLMEMVCLTSCTRMLWIN